MIGDGFIAVCSCGWRSSPQRAAGVAGALLDAHRNEARGPSPRDGDGEPPSSDDGPMT